MGEHEEYMKIITYLDRIGGDIERVMDILNDIINEKTVVSYTENIILAGEAVLCLGPLLIAIGEEEMRFNEMAIEHEELESR